MIEVAFRGGVEFIQQGLGYRFRITDIQELIRDRNIGREARDTCIAATRVERLYRVVLLEPTVTEMRSVWLR